MPRLQCSLASTYFQRTSAGSHYCFIGIARLGDPTLVSAATATPRMATVMCAGVPTFGDDGESPAGIGMEDGERPRLATLYARIDRWIVRRKLGQHFQLVNADQRPRRVGEVALPRLPRFPPPQPRIDRAGRSIRIPLPRRAVRPMGERKRPQVGAVIR